MNARLGSWEARTKGEPDWAHPLWVRGLPAQTPAFSALPLGLPEKSCLLLGFLMISLAKNACVALLSSSLVLCSDALCSSVSQYFPWFIITWGCLAYSLTASPSRRQEGRSHGTWNKTGLNKHLSNAQWKQLEF